MYSPKRALARWGIQPRQRGWRSTHAHPAQASKPQRKHCRGWPGAWGCARTPHVICWRRPAATQPPVSTSPRRPVTENSAWPAPPRSRCAARPPSPACMALPLELGVDQRQLQRRPRREGPLGAVVQASEAAFRRSRNDLQRRKGRNNCRANGADDEKEDDGARPHANLLSPCLGGQGECVTTAPTHCALRAQCVALYGPLPRSVRARLAHHQANRGVVGITWRRPRSLGPRFAMALGGPSPHAGAR